MEYLFELISEIALYYSPGLRRFLIGLLFFAGVCFGTLIWWNGNPVLAILVYLLDICLGIWAYRLSERIDSQDGAASDQIQ